MEGKKGKISRTIPGSIDVDEREFFYVEIRSDERFRTVIDEALAGSPVVPLPKSGGVVDEKTRILLDESSSLLGISYKGDLEGWRAKLVAYCKAKNRKWGIASRQILTLSDGTEHSLFECKVIFDD